MSDFKQAIEWLKEGKKVRRDKFYYWILKNNGFVCFDLSDIEYSEVGLTLEDIEATDWEIYCEEHDWAGIEKVGKPELAYYICNNCGEQKGEDTKES